MMTNKIVVADDGSTSVKLAWFEEDELKTFTSSNSAEFGKGFSEDGGRNYTVFDKSNSETTFCFMENADSIRSKNERFQYDAHSVASIHHGLHKAGIEGQNVTLAVTLPLSQYYKGTRINEENINKKKASILRRVDSDSKSKTNTISDVVVYPEGIPACYPNLVNEKGEPLVDEEELTFLADFGGTTLDLCLFSGAASDILKAESFSLGMFDTFDDVMRDSGIPKRRDLILKKLLETGQASGGKFSIDRHQTTLPIMEKAQNLILDFLGDDLRLLSNCFCIGGGADLLSKNLAKIEGVNPVVIDNPVEALARSIASIMEK